LRVCGSETLGRTAGAWVREWSALEPEVAVETHFPGSGSFLSTLMDNTCQIALLSREPDASQRKAMEAARPGEYRTVQIGWDEVVFFVHRTSPRSTVTLDQLRKLWTGEAGKVHLYGRNELSGTHAWVRSQILGGKDYALGIREYPGPAGVIRAVANDPLGIGYSGREALHGEVKPLTVLGPDGQPQRWLRPLFLVHRPANPLSQRFVSYVLSDAGQEQLRHNGLDRLSPLHPAMYP
jgi:phosphate transport system substrate-binding protein